MLLRWCEYFLLFWLTPVVLYIYRDFMPSLLLPIILLASAYCVFRLWQKRILHNQIKLIKEISREHLTAVLLPLLICAMVLLTLVYIFIPEKLFDLPSNTPYAWLLLLLLYPIVSVIPQEVIFRSFFFHRYRKLFLSEKLRWFFSSISFGLAHLFYANWLAVIMSFFGGLLFGYRFLQSGKNISVVVLEHSLWGMMLFTIGFGSYFIVSMPLSG